jgi:hypothetical protein
MWIGIAIGLVLFYLAMAGLAIGGDSYRPPHM